MQKILLKLKLWFTFFLNMENFSEVNLTRREINGTYIYIDSCGNEYNNQGRKTTTAISQPKFETVLEKESKHTKNKQIKNYKQKEKAQTTHNSTIMDTQFALNVHNFTKTLFEAMLTEFDGKVVGSDEMNLETLMKHHFPDYKPGDKVKGAKKEKKPKEPRPLSGYTFFGQQNKEKFNKEMEKMDDKPKFVSYVADKWKSLSDDEKKEWTEKAVKVFEDSNK